MKISNSKKQLAKIISENGGWREGAEFSAQDRLHALVDFYEGRPRRDKDDDYWYLPGGRLKAETFEAKNVIANWHQTILSRDEYFHLYPAPYADGWIEWKGGEYPGGSGVAKRRDGVEVEVEVEASKPERIVIATEPTIEQLAADYRAKLAIAQQAQEEADTHRCGADAALSRLENACLELGFEIKPASGRAIADMTPKLNITDWRDLRVGDVIWIGDSANTSNAPSGEYTVIEFDPEYLAGRTLSEQYGIAQPIRVNGGHWPDLIERKWRFIRRP